ncbi:hypothetical protein BD779DRAFT_1524620 [Infundibulicybe gibba]|nr:hypothetical protein BD779DRAFT_1524620 [Infundibulicybe gibba]
MPLYHIDTPVRIFKRPVTTIKKFSGSSEAVMATIYARGGHKSVECWGRNITPYRGGLLTTSERFQASDGRSYKWRVDGRDFTRLYTDDGTSTPVATFNSGPMGPFSTSRPPRLAVAPQGMPILDDIVATFVHMDRRRRERQGYSTVFCLDLLLFYIFYLGLLLIYVFGYLNPYGFSNL